VQPAEWHTLCRRLLQLSVRHPAGCSSPPVLLAAAVPHTANSCNLQDGPGGERAWDGGDGMVVVKVAELGKRGDGDGVCGVAGGVRQWWWCWWHACVSARVAGG